MDQNPSGTNPFLDPSGPGIPGQPGRGSFQVPIPNSTAVLVLGIISIPTCICYGIVGIVLGIIAVILAGRAHQAWQTNPDQYTEASYKNLKAGRICGIVGLILGIIYLIYVIFMLAFMGSAWLRMMRDLS